MTRSAADLRHEVVEPTSIAESDQRHVRLALEVFRQAVADSDDAITGVCVAAVGDRLEHAV
jgi:hypothetical protein